MEYILEKMKKIFKKIILVILCFFIILFYLPFIIISGAVEFLGDIYKKLRG